MRVEKYKKLDDGELLALISKDSSSAFDEVYNRYWQILVKTAYNVTQDKEVCRDCVQEIFVKLWVKRNELEIRDLPRYLFRSVRLKVFEHLRNNNISQKHLSRINFISVTNNTQELINRKDLNDELNASLAKLPERCKEVFKLSRFDSLPNRQVAKKLNISLKTVEGHITKALKQLYKDMGDHITLLLLSYFL